MRWSDGGNACRLFAGFVLVLLDVDDDSFGRFPCFSLRACALPKALLMRSNVDAIADYFLDI